MRMRMMITGILALMLVFAVGCQQNRAGNADVKDSIEKGYEQANIDGVNVDYDQEHRVVTLKGDVESAAMKDQAEAIARQHAGGAEIANEIGVRPEGQAGDNAETAASNFDDSIEAAFKAEMAKSGMDNMEGMDVKADSNNGVLTLEGDVKNAAQKQQVEKMASGLENVKQVVNKLEVEGQNRDAAGR
jgi:osmotically-inducible protein OsmY